jgi:FtsP/CotA-like multicopper oxidase with cupredoxin domain
MERRDFIKLGLSAITAGCVTGLPPIFKVTEALAARQTVILNITEVFHEMVDLTQVYSWAYASPATGPNIPGPVIFATDGELIRIRINNTLDEPHGFAIPGLFEFSSLIDSGPIPPRQSRTLAFPAPPPGTYLYEDPVNFPVNRVLGLHGMLIVMPRATVSGNALTPYRVPTPAVQQLFNDLGNSAHFPAPGEPWKPERTTLWVFSEIDPIYNEMASLNQFIDPADFVSNFLPRYFTINGKSGYFGANDPDTALRGKAGEPRLIRNIHAGLDTHSPHTHANHSYQLAINGTVESNVFWLDTWAMVPGDRKDLLFPMMPPPDIPGDTWARLKNGTSTEGQFNNNPQHPGPGLQGFPLAYPMHSHLELSQTAAGGNYPQGLVTHIEFEGTLV